MGTSQKFQGPNNKSPLIPSWLTDEQSKDGQTKQDIVLPDIPLPQQDKRFQVARSNFTRYLNGNNKEELARKTFKSYVSNSLGGSRKATQRIKISQNVASNLFRLIGEIHRNGYDNTLKKYQLYNPENSSITTSLSSLIDIVCLNDIDGGNIDESLARNAAMLVLTELPDGEDIDTFFNERKTALLLLEKFVVKTIEIKMVNDIGQTLYNMPDQQIEDNLDYLRGFIEFSVHKSVEALPDNSFEIDDVTVKNIISDIYFDAYKYLEGLGEDE